MTYDRLAESVALIQHGLRSDPARLSRRRRFAALAVDVDGDVACTAFVRRGVSCPEGDTHLLERRGDTWRLLGGGGGSWDDDGFADRPGAVELGGLVVVRGGGSVLRNADRRMPWGARYVHDVQLRVSAEVHAVVVGGSRTLTVPRHGHLVVVWAGGRPPALAVHDRVGRLLAPVPPLDGTVPWVR
ncbi:MULTISPECIES: hypothetical protein [Modestobacter]|uniref:hypothetical protein n=1 Tax=Modestobacter TaxID=88138 RepID=UPI00068AB886|nr:MULTISPECIES: hypothetical protein [Modestobacter]